MKKVILLVLTVLWIVVVAILFRTISDTKVAGVIAGIGFFILPQMILWQQRQSPWIFKLLTLQFWILFAIPILFSRLLFWQEEFKNFTFFGVFTGDQWHKFSSTSYSLMLLGLAAQIFLEFKASRKSSSTP